MIDARIPGPFPLGLHGPTVRICGRTYRVFASWPKPVSACASVAQSVWRVDGSRVGPQCRRGARRCGPARKRGARSTWAVNWVGGRAIMAATAHRRSRRSYLPAIAGRPGSILCRVSADQRQVSDLASLAHRRRLTPRRPTAGCVSGQKVWTSLRDDGISCVLAARPLNPAASTSRRLTLVCPMGRRASSPA